MTDNSESSFTVTLVYAATGASESIPVQQNTTTVAQLQEWAYALFGIDAPAGNNDANPYRLLKDGKPLVIPTATLTQAQIGNGDMLALAKLQPTLQTSPAPAAAASSGGLDFSNLLAATPTATSSTNTPPEPVYWAGMNLAEAQQSNPHPVAFVTLLLKTDHLKKELNYYDPVLASKLVPPIEHAAKVWRDRMVKDGVAGAMRQSSTFHKESTMRQRLTKNADDAEAKAYFDTKERKKLIDEQYRQVVNEYPESMGRVLMLYVSAKINGHVIQAFCDSGAQSTIMSKKLARACDIEQYIDERMAGTAVGVGTGVILGRIHSVQLQIEGYYFPCSITVMDDPVGQAKEMPFLLGLDMMKRHTAVLDLGAGCMKFRLAPGSYMETPFLHEKDLTAEQGGTMGFDADKANMANLEHLQKMDEDDDDKDTKSDKAN